MPPPRVGRVAAAPPHVFLPMEPTLAAFVRLSLPVSCAHVCMVLLQLTDLAVVGRLLGAEQLAVRLHNTLCTLCCASAQHPVHPAAALLRRFASCLSWST